MLSLSLPLEIFLCVEPTDMRSGFDRLAQRAKDHAHRDVLLGGLFVFFNRRRNRVKLLYWDSDGLVVWSKKLETEDTQIFGFQEVLQATYNRRLGLAEIGRMVRIPRKSGPRRCPMPRQGSLPVPPRAHWQRTSFCWTSSGRS
jgi:hypothetical protein